MKVLMINGSPHAEGNTAAALEEMKKIFFVNDVSKLDDVFVGGDE